MILCTGKTKEHNNAINTEAKKLRCAPLFVAGYGWRYVFKKHLDYTYALTYA
jgi:hypothetical protein